MQNLTNKKTRCILIEDEEHSMELLESIIEDYCPNVQIVGKAKTVEDSILLLKDVPCDMLFLDVQLGDRLSFEILDAFEFWNFEIIFLSAYDQYAFQAFQVEALDYVLKPYSPKQIIKAVNKALSTRQRITPTVIKNLYSMLMEQEAPRISLSTHEGITWVSISDIIHCQADGAYCTVYANNDTRVVVSKNLRQMEEIINDQQHFVRVHAGHLVNTRYISKYQKDDGGMLVMSNGSQIPVSRSKKGDVMAMML